MLPCEDDSVVAGGCGGDDNGLSGNVGALWHKIGNKTASAREKASKCLHEHNGIVNKAIAALVKTITAKSDAYPVDYTTLMKKVAVEYEPMTLPQQQQQQWGGATVPPLLLNQ